MSTKTRFEKEAKGNSEMAYSKIEAKCNQRVGTYLNHKLKPLQILAVYYKVENS